MDNQQTHNVVEQITVQQAIELLQRSNAKGREIPHVISVVRDSNDLSRIIAINAVEQA